MPTRITKFFRAVLATVFVLATAAPAFGGSYLDRSALIVEQSEEDADYLRARLRDKELARVIHALAEARLKAGSTMTVPEEVVQAHPHLIVALENYERAASAAREGESQRFLIYQQRARDETRTFESVLNQLGFKLPRRR